MEMKLLSRVQTTRYTAQSGETSPAGCYQRQRFLQTSPGFVSSMQLTYIFQGWHIRSHRDCCFSSGACTRTTCPGKGCLQEHHHLHLHATRRSLCCLWGTKASGRRHHTVCPKGGAAVTLQLKYMHRIEASYSTSGRTFRLDLFNSSK